MKRSFSILLTLTILAGLTAIPAFASTDAETVYYFNDFTNAETDNRYYITNGEIKDGILRYNRGGGVTFTDENTTKKADALGVKIYESGEVKPDIKVEYSITLPTYASTFSNNTRYVTSNFGTYYYGIDTVDITTYNIWPGKKEASGHYTKDTDNAMFTDEGKVYGKTYNVKILYSATNDIKTIYINDVCLGTYNLKTDYSSWKNDTTGYFKLGFTFAGTVHNSWKTEEREIKLDNVKISKLEENMISVPVNLTAEDNILPVEHYSSLWIPEGEKVKLNLGVAEGKTLSVKLNDETYIDSFTSDYSYTTPSLNENDTLTILSNDVETNFAAYTKPYVFQYTRDDGCKAVVILGRMVEVTGYTSNSYGIFYSMVNPDVTPTTEGVHPARLQAGDERVVDGNFAIELYHPELKTGDKIYYKSYAYYKNINDETDKPQVFGEVNTIVIE